MLLCGNYIDLQCVFCRWWQKRTSNNFDELFHVLQTRKNVRKDIEDLRIADLYGRIHISVRDKVCDRIVALAETTNARG